MTDPAHDDIACDAPLPRFTSKGRAFVYVVPCRDDTLFKIGYSRDPLQRLRAMHRRFFAFFDLDRAVLIETSRVRAALALEQRLIAYASPFTALAPPIVSDAA